jgi:hypothetical protein
MRNIVRIISLILLLSFCTEKKYSPLYFILGSHLRSGLNRPEKVKNIQVDYNVSLLSVELKWDPSIDPDTKQVVPYYFIYLYYEYPKPEQYYDKKYLLDITNIPQYTLFTGTFVGTLFFIITAYDLGAESEISDIIRVDVP